jgi:uncharacterized membrane protein YphA (DoxX/SURF4 family)
MGGPMGPEVQANGLQHLPGGLILLKLFGDVYWPYVAGAVVLLAGLAAARSDVLRARGLEKIVALGAVLYAAPMAVFGAQHFTFARFVVQMIPAYMPGKWFWTYFVGVALLAAAISIALKRYVPFSGPLLSLMIFLFVILLHVPRVAANPHDRISWVVLVRDLSFSCGALALAATYSESWKTGTRNLLATVARVIISVALVMFGVEQFLYPLGLPGVPLEKQTPLWIPGHSLWPYLTGIVFVLGGACLLLNRKTRLAATVAGVMVLALVIFVYLPYMVSTFPDIATGLNYFADTLTFCGTLLVLADAMPKEERIHV